MNLITRWSIRLAFSALKSWLTVDKLAGLASAAATHLLHSISSNPDKTAQWCDAIGRIAPIASQMAQAVADKTITSTEAKAIADSISSACQSSRLNDEIIADTIDSIRDRILDK